MAGRPCPGLPSGTICDNGGFVHMSPNGFVKLKDGSKIPRVKYERFCTKHRKEDIAFKRFKQKTPSSGLRPTQGGVLKKQAKQIRNLEQKLRTAQADIHDYSSRSRDIRSKQRRLSTEYTRTINFLGDQSRHQEENFIAEKSKLLADISQLSESLDNTKERNRARLQRHVDALASAKAKLGRSYTSMRLLIKEQAQLEAEVEEAKAQLATATPASTRKRSTKKPANVAKRRADLLVDNYIEPRGWDRASVVCILGKLIRRYEISLDEVTNASMDQRLVVAFPTATDESAFSIYLKRMDKAMLADLIPDDVRRLLISRYVAKVQDFWSPLRCALIKNTLKISNLNWVWMRQLLGRSINEDGKLVDHEIDGVCVPLLAGKNSIIKVGETAASAQGVNKVGSPESFGGLVALRSARALIQDMIRVDINALSGDEPQLSHILKWSADKAPAGKNLSFTQICLTLNPAQKDLGGSPMHTRVAAVFHGGEDPHTLWKLAKPVMEEISAILESGEIEVPLLDGQGTIVTCKVSCKFGSDEKLKFGAHMHMGPSGYCGCWQCELKSSKMLVTGQEDLRKHGGTTLRTIDSIMLNAHMTVTDMCEGCGMAVVATREEMDKLNQGIKHKSRWKAIIVCTGDPSVDEPQPWIQKSFKDPTTKKKTTWIWSYRHKSIYYGGGPKPWKLMFRKARISMWVTCTLHCRQRTTSLNVKAGICQWLDRDWNRAKKKTGNKSGWLDGPQTMLLSSMFECFLPKGRTVPVLETVSTLLTRQVSGRLLGIASRNWTGTACKLIEKFSKFLVTATFPESICEDSPETLVNKTRSLALFQTHAHFMTLFCSRLDYGPNPTDLRVVEVREQHAKKVEAAGKAYVNALKVLYPECQAYYPHCMAMHCGDDVREHGSPVDYAQEGDEAKNLETRTILMGSSNNQLETRLRTVMKHYATLDAVATSVKDPSLAAHIDRKHSQAERWNATRKKTTKSRLKGKLDDLGSAMQESSDGSQLCEAFFKSQKDRTAQMKHERDIETQGRRERARALKKAKKNDTSTSATSN